jgi:hypothetical protein
MPVLVAYGVPPNKIKLFSSTGVNLHKTWQFEPRTFTGAVRESFERLLRIALLAFAGTEIPDLARADYRFVPDFQTLGRLLTRGRYARLVYYGHALSDGVTLLPLHRITAQQLAQVLAGSAVEHVDIFGCNSSAIGALLASLLPRLKVGTLRGKRFDDIEVNLATMQLTDFRILSQPVFHLGPAPQATSR